MVVNLALGMITPPFGVNLFAACTVARISLDRIVVQLPGVQDTAKAKDILGRTATLEIRMVDDTPGAIEAAQVEQRRGDLLAGAMPVHRRLGDQRAIAESFNREGRGGVRRVHAQEITHTLVSRNNYLREHVDFPVS